MKVGPLLGLVLGLEGMADGAEASGEAYGQPAQERLAQLGGPFSSNSIPQRIWTSTASGPVWLRRVWVTFRAPRSSCHDRQAQAQPTLGPIVLSP